MSAKDISDEHNRTTPVIRNMESPIRSPMFHLETGKSSTVESMDLRELVSKSKQSTEGNEIDYNPKRKVSKQSSNFFDSTDKKGGFSNAHNFERFDLETIKLDESSCEDRKAKFEAMGNENNHVESTQLQTIQTQKELIKPELVTSEIHQKPSTIVLRDISSSLNPKINKNVFNEPKKTG
jgi:hypothetical protein